MTAVWVGYWADFQFGGVLHDTVSISGGWCCDCEFVGLEKWRACRDGRYFFGHYAAGTGRSTEHNQYCGQNWNKTRVPYTVIRRLTLRLLMSYIYIYIYMERLFLMFLDHTQRRSTVGRTPLDE